MRPELVVIPRGTVDPSVLPPELLTLARAAFGPGVQAPAARPTAEAWLRALDRERGLVRVGQNRPLHAYGSHLPTCPWCTRAAVTGHDVFNGPPPVPVPVAPPQEKQPWPVGLKVALLILAVLVLLIIVVLSDRAGG
ncbi:hypothetical protein ACFWP7_30155 [Streptomyces sp. NPDC058470]|uniref:hypothetical protein n=1 Tax=Streptomyces sp. NPDC058470 TaxID=3346515 RepID=UPI003654FB03